MNIISKKSRCALHGMAYLGQYGNGKPVPFEDILAYLREYASGLTLSSGYIAKVFQTVSRAGIVEAVTGPSGGYRLARPANEIRLIEIIESLEGPLLSNCCPLSVAGCRQRPKCGVGSLIRESEMVFQRFFERHTVATLARKMNFPSRVQPVL